MNSIDLLDPQVIADDYPLFRLFHRQDPVQSSNHYQPWIIFHFDDTMTTYRNPAFSSEHLDLVFKRDSQCQSEVEQRSLAGWMEFRDPHVHSQKVSSRFPTLEIETLLPEWKSNILSRSLKSLQVTLSP